MKKNVNKIFVYVFFILVVCGVALLESYTKITKENMRYYQEKSSEVIIKDEEDLLQLSNAYYNDNIKLAADITLTKAIPYTRPFEGVFDGNGFTITCNWGSEEDVSPLFRIIEKGAIVKNLTVVTNDFKAKGNNYAIFALNNKGTIENCRVSVTNMNVSSSNPGIYSFVASNNSGLLKNIIVNGQLSKVVDGTKDNENSIKFGAICAYNDGMIEKCIANMEYRALANVKRANVANGAKNDHIGVLVSTNLSAGKVNNCAMCISDDYYTCDMGQGIDFYSSLKDLITEQNIYFKYDFSNQIWNVDEASKNVSLIRSK